MAPVDLCMMTYVLIPGAGGDAWYWHLVVPLLEEAGHRAVAVELPSSDPDAGLEAYVAATLDAVGQPPGDTVVVGQSLGGFVAPVAAERLDAVELIFVAAMIPSPGETPGEWWAATGFDEMWGDRELDPLEHFLHDLPPALLRTALERGDIRQTERIMVDPLPLPCLPAIPTRGIAATHDRFFPAEFMNRVIRDRLQVEPEYAAAGHLPALANPAGLVEVLLAKPT